MSECHCCGVDSEEIAEYDRMKAARKWTSEPPKEIGWYWARLLIGGDDFDKGDVVMVCVIRRGLTEEVALLPGWEVGMKLDEFDLWCGPIEAPALP